MQTYIPSYIPNLHSKYYCIKFYNLRSETVMVASYSSTMVKMAWTSLRHVFSVRSNFHFLPIIIRLVVYMCVYNMLQWGVFLLSNHWIVTIGITIYSEREIENIALLQCCFQDVHYRESYYTVLLENLRTLNIILCIFLQWSSCMLVVPVVYT